MNVQGVVYHSSLEGERDSCTIEVNSSTVNAKTPSGGSFSIPLNELELSLGGTSSSLIFLRMRNQKEPSFSTRDKKITTLLKKCGGTFDIEEAVGKVQKDVLKWRSWLIGSLAFVILFIGGSLVGLHFYGPSIVISVLPNSVDQKLGEMQSLPQSVAKDTLVSSAIDKIVARLVTHLDNSPFEYNVRVVKNSQINAYALPGGKIVVFTGLIEKSISPEEVAGVLAHEIMHVEQRHGVKNIVHSLGFSIIMMSIFGDSPEVVESVLAKGKQLVGLKFSRDMENEADTKAFHLLQKAKINPKDFRNFFVTLQNENQVDVPEWFSTHPNTQRRIDNMDNMLKESQGDFVSFDIDWESVKRSLK